MKLQKTKSEKVNESLVGNWKKITKKPIVIKAKRKSSLKYKKEYQEFLKSDYWKSVRLSVLIRDGFKCLHCSGNTKLQVHHTTYVHHKREHLFLNDLKTLCDKCHKKAHRTK